MSSPLILVGMSRKLRNWNYHDATAFLKEHGFSFQKSLKGSHQAWIKRGENGGPDRRVEVSIPRDSYHPKTFKNMIRQSGIAEDVWTKWGNS
jgi:predicted RNA binding protein YcfA (HicA-like mRNA interferase family)